MNRALITPAFLLLLFWSGEAVGQKKYTHADTLRGSITAERSWWNVLKYDLHVSFDPNAKTVRGFNAIHYQVLDTYAVLQLDLMAPLELDSVEQDGKKLTFHRDGNAFFVQLDSPQLPGSRRTLTAYYHGQPRAARMPPWDGGVVWARDHHQRPWITVTCQGIGPSVWYPNKDHQYDEPDSADLHITVPDSLVAVGNGRLVRTVTHEGGLVTYSWAVRSPINNYNLIPYIGKYVHLREVHDGEKGTLDVDYWVLEYQPESAVRHLQAEVRRTLKNLEHWFGPYPFYNDGFKMVESPHLGMEHQSAIAYGNKYQNGYLGRDLSGSGWGLKWDFIVVHESAHEWFGNSISTKDLADMWVHEGFANYSETLFTESEHGKEAGSDYITGSRKGISNDMPIIPAYNVNAGGSGDMYPKGGNLIHNIRQLLDDDEKFRGLLRGLNTEFYHQTVTSEQIEDYISSRVGRDLSRVFDQYLRTTKVPVLNYSVHTQGKLQRMTYHWTNCVSGFDMPVKIHSKGGSRWIFPTETPQSIEWVGPVPEKIIDRNFYAGEKRE